MEIISRLKIKYLLTLSLLIIATILFSTVAVLAAQNVNVDTNVSVIYTAVNYVLVEGDDFNAKIPSDCTSIIFGKVDDLRYSDVIKLPNVEAMDEAGLGTIKKYYDTTNKVAYILSEGIIQFNSSCLDMFINMTKIENITFENINTSQVTTMRRMFDTTTSLVTLDLTNFNTKNVKDMFFMFGSTQSGSQLKEIIFSDKFTTNNVTDMGRMFYRLSSLTTLDLSGFDTSNVADMEYMFFECESLKILDLSSFNTSKVTDMSGMFQYCENLQIVMVSDLWTTTKVTSSNLMFYFCHAIRGECGTEYHTAAQDKTYARIDTATTHGYFSTTSTLYPHIRALPETITEIVFDKTTNQSSTTTDATYASKVIGDVTEYISADKTKVYYLSDNAIELNNCNWLFGNRTALKNISFNNVDTRKTKTMSGMFQDCTGLTSLDLSNFNTGNVTNMSQMFKYCNNLKTIYVGDHWNLNKVTSGANMFTDCWYLVGGSGTTYNKSYVDKTYAKVDGGVSDPGYFSEKVLLADAATVSGVIPIDCNKVEFGFKYNHASEIEGATDMGSLAKDGSEDIKYYYNSTSKVMYILANGGITLPTSCNALFKNKTDLTSIEFNNVDTSGVTSMQSMFEGCSGLTSLDLSGFNTGNVTIMSDMFMGCSSIVNLDLSKWNVANVKRMDGQFNGCISLEEINLTGWNTISVELMSLMFKNCSSLTTIDLGSFNTINATNMWEMFYGCTSLSNLNISSFNTSKVIYMRYMFYECSSLTELNLSHFNTSSVREMGYMFWGCSGLQTLDLSSFDTSNVTNMDSIFACCSNLTDVVVSSFNTSKVTNFHRLFYKCINIESVDLSNFDTSNATRLDSMFQNCNKLKVVDLSNFNTSKATAIDGIFFYCGLLETVYSNNDWEFLDAANTSAMFQGCVNLVGGQGTVYNASFVNDEYAKVDGGVSDPGYLTVKSN